MSISLVRARMLCTRDELKLIQASAGPELRKLSPAQLNRLIGRAQRLRDKWLDQSRAQRRKTQEAQRSRPTGANARSGEKAKLFTSVVTKLSSRLAALEQPAKGGRTSAADNSGNAGKPPSKSAANRRPTPGGPRVGKGRGNRSLPAPATKGLNLNRRDQLNARASGKRTQFGAAGAVRVQAHTVTRNKRNQARRDARQ